MTGLNNSVSIIFLDSRSKWSVQSIHSKNYVAIIHLLVALATHFRPNLRLPEYVSIPVVVLSKENNRIKQVNFIKSFQDYRFIFLSQILSVEF